MAQCLVNLSQMKPFPIFVLSRLPPTPPHSPRPLPNALSSSLGFFLQSQLSAWLDTASTRIPHFLFELRTTIGNTSHNSEPQSLPQFHLRMARTCTERRNFSACAVSSPQIFYFFTTRRLHAHPPQYLHCLHTCMRLSVFVTGLP